MFGWFVKRFVENFEGSIFPRSHYKTLEPHYKTLALFFFLCPGLIMRFRFFWGVRAGHYITAVPTLYKGRNGWGEGGRKEEKIDEMKGNERIQK